MIVANGDSWTGGRTIAACYWPNYLSARLGRSVENLAVQGSSNQRILRTTLARIFSADMPIEQIIVGWSSLDRAELPRARGGHYSITPVRAFAPEPEPLATAELLHNLYYQHCHNDMSAIKSFLQGLLVLQSVCRDKGIALLNFQSFRDNFHSIQTHPELTALQQQLDPAQWISSTMKDSLTEYPTLPSQHVNDQGNERWADVIALRLAK